MTHAVLDHILSQEVDTLKHSEELNNILQHFDGDHRMRRFLSHFNSPRDLDDFIAHYGVKGMKWGKRKKEDSSAGGVYLDEKDQAEYDKLMDAYKEAVDKIRTDLLSGNVLDAIKSHKKAKSISSGRLKTLIEKQDKLDKKNEDRIDKLLKDMGHSYPSDDLDDLDDFIAHYGVLGMKWGIRKDRSSGSRRSEKDAKKEERRARVTKPVSKGSSRVSNKFEDNPKNVRLTDAELRKIVDRIRLEQEFSRLTTPPPLPPKVESRFKKALVDTAYSVGTGAVSEVGKAVLSQALKVEFNKRASTPYKLNIKGVKDAIEEATKD